MVALRGTATTTEWWNDFQWDLVPFTQVPGGGNVAQGFHDIYSTFGTMAPGQQQSMPAPGAFAADVAAAATEGLAAEVDPAGLPIVVTGHSLGGALATLLVADLTANTPLKPQAWTFASPNVGDAAFAARYAALSTVSWRIYNQGKDGPLRGAMPGMKLGAGRGLRVVCRVPQDGAGREGACWAWRAVRRHRFTLDRSRP